MLESVDRNDREVTPRPVRLIGLFSKPVRETVEMLCEFQEPFVVDHSRYAAAFGADNGHGPTAMETAIAETVAWYRSRPGLN